MTDQNDIAPKKRHGGRPTVRTEENWAKIVDAIEQGYIEADAYRMAGISESSYIDWKATDSAFSAAIKDAVKTRKARWVKHIENDPSWQSKAWLLERIHPAEFAKREHLDLTTKDEPITEVRIVRTTADRGLADPE